MMARLALLADALALLGVVTIGVVLYLWEPRAFLVFLGVISILGGRMLGRWVSVKTNRRGGS